MQPLNEAPPVHDEQTRSQIAALPWRRGQQGLEIMLLSSRQTKRWVIPKGWPMKGRKPYAAATQEAREEAGLVGKIAKEPMGHFHYVKNMSNGAALLCRVDVFALQVEKQLKNWPERDQRITRWFALEEAAELVREPELTALIRAFSPPMREKTKTA